MSWLWFGENRDWDGNGMKCTNMGYDLYTFLLLHCLGCMHGCFRCLDKKALQEKQDGFKGWYSMIYNATGFKGKGLGYDGTDRHKFRTCPKETHSQK